jgi:amino acid permease
VFHRKVTTGLFLSKMAQSDIQPVNMEEKNEIITAAEQGGGSEHSGEAEKGLRNGPRLERQLGPRQLQMIAIGKFGSEKVFI